jgi:hypothetical protein
VVAVSWDGHFEGAKVSVRGEANGKDWSLKRFSQLGLIEYLEKSRLTVHREEDVECNSKWNRCLCITKQKRD